MACVWNRLTSAAQTRVKAATVYPSSTGITVTAVWVSMVSDVNTSSRNVAVHRVYAKMEVQTMLRHQCAKNLYNL